MPPPYLLCAVQRLIAEQIVDVPGDLFASVERDRGHEAHDRDQKRRSCDALQDGGFVARLSDDDWYSLCFHDLDPFCGKNRVSCATE